MALGISQFFSTPFFSQSVAPDPLKTSWVTSILFKLHTMTGTFFFLLSCFVYVRELIGEHIHCITESASKSHVTLEAFESYCYIHSTFTLPNQPAMKSQGESRVYPGVGPIGSNNRNELIYHNYYMWVPYMLFFQSLSFYLPFILHKFFQDGRAQLLISDLQNLIPMPETRDDMYSDINLYFKDWYNHQNWWAIKIVLCEFLNIVVTIFNFLLMDWYLGNQFFSFGIEALAFMTTSEQLRSIDPFNLLFPKMTKCTLETYGPSGTIQNFDGLCILPINVINEKIFFLLWFVMMVLGAFTIIYTLLVCVIMMVSTIRNNFLTLYLSPERPLLRKKLLRILSLSGFGDWMMLYLIARNTDKVIFSQLIKELKPPDYRYDLEPLDEENQRLERILEKSEEDSLDDEPDKRYFINTLAKK